MDASESTTQNDTGGAELPLISTVEQVHETYPVLSRDHLYSAARAGELRVIRRGRRILIPRSALLEYLGELR